VGLIGDLNWGLTTLVNGAVGLPAPPVPGIPAIAPPPYYPPAPPVLGTLFPQTPVRLPGLIPQPPPPTLPVFGGQGAWGGSQFTPGVDAIGGGGWTTAVKLAKGAATIATPEAIGALLAGQAAWWAGGKVWKYLTEPPKYRPGPPLPPPLTPKQKWNYGIA
jgi:hypothetical protein